MNILDENTKSALDAGQTVVLSGGYIVMSPETFRYALETSCKETLHAVFDKETPDQGTAIEANDSSICAMCGGDDIAGTACSRLILETGYGSANDLERVTVPLCGECADRLYAEMTQMPGARIDDIQI